MTSMNCSRRKTDTDCLHPSSIRREQPRTLREHQPSLQDLVRPHPPLRRQPRHRPAARPRRVQQEQQEVLHHLTKRSLPDRPIRQIRVSLGWRAFGSTVALHRHLPLRPGRCGVFAFHTIDASVL